MCRQCTDDPSELETCSLCTAEVPLVTLLPLTVRDPLTGKALDRWEHVCRACRVEGNLASSPS